MDLAQKNIVVLGLKRIGDAVYTLPTFSAIKRAFPTAHITIMTEPQVTAIYEKNPFIDTIINIPQKGFWKCALAHLRLGGYDVCIINHNALKYALLPFFARIPVRVGYQKEGRSVFLTHKRPLHKTIVHRLEHNARLLDLLALESRDLLPSIYCADSDVELTSTLLNKFELKNTNYIVFIVGSIAETRRWFPENFAQLALKIATDLQMKIVILGGPDDKDIAINVVNHFKKLKINPNMLINLAGQTSLRETMLLFSRARAVASNDTGPLHVASAMSRPVVTWFGAANENEIAPPSRQTVVLNANVSCSPCVKEICPLKTLECLQKITPNDVFNTLKKII